ncbi:MAG: diaminopimelate epimerase, partial [Muribaculaceae bacterium]|nr:diaminopimelate epimerase [Muribaculaceae bacterium]
SVTVDMGPAILNRGGIPAGVDHCARMTDEPVKVDGKEFLITGIGMGNPHGVIFTEEITDSLVFDYGPLLETLEIWPEKANIEFIKVRDKKNLEMRVWERGSGETLACGTGACASAVASYLKGLTDAEVDIKLLGGTLHIKFDTDSGHVFMTGPAEFVAEGVYFYQS